MNLNLDAPASVAEPDSEICVLHVDDAGDFTDLTAAFLEHQNSSLSVVSETNAKDALTRLVDEDIDAVVSDYNMPGTDGIEFLVQVREICPTLPFILFTGRGSEEVASEAISCGVTDYLQKSPGGDRFQLLANRIVNAVEKARAERRLRKTRLVHEEISRFATDAFWTWDPAVDHLTLSDGFEGVFAHPPGTLKNGSSWASKHIHPEDRDAVLGNVRQTLETRTKNVKTTFRFRRGDGAYVDVLLRHSALSIGYGEADYMVGVLIDRTVQGR